MVKKWPSLIAIVGMDVLLSETRLSVKNYLKLNCRIRLIEQSSVSDVTGPDGSCFLAAWAISMSFRNVRQKPNLPIWKGNPSPRCSARAYYSANAFSQGRAMLPGQGTQSTSFEGRQSCSQTSKTSRHTR